MRGRETQGGVEGADTPGKEWRRVPIALPSPGRTAVCEVGGERVLLCHAEGRGFALEDRCPHQEQPLGGGRLMGFVLECPLHGGKLDVRDGRPLARPIRRAARSFELREHEGSLWIRLPGPDDS